MFANKFRSRGAFLFFSMFAYLKQCSLLRIPFFTLDWNSIDKILWAKPILCLREKRLFNKLVSLMKCILTSNTKLMLTFQKASVCVRTWPFTFKGQGLTERVEISTPFQSEIETYLLIWCVTSYKTKAIKLQTKSGGDCQTNRQTHTDIHTDRQTHRQTDKALFLLVLRMNNAARPSRETCVD